MGISEISTMSNIGSDNELAEYENDMSILALNLDGSTLYEILR